MTKYTHPPYQLEEDIEEGDSITIYAGGGAAPIGYVLNYSDFPCADEAEDLPKLHAEAMATARLFTASPELLEELKALVCRGCENRIGYTGPTRYRDWRSCASCAKARAAIAKAEHVTSNVGAESAP